LPVLDRSVLNILFATIRTAFIIVAWQAPYGHYVLLLHIYEYTKLTTEHSIGSQICINIHPDAVPPIHAESYHVATDKGPLQVPVYF